MPPAFSAKKIKGVPAYKLARKKQEVELKPVEVEVLEFAITGAEGDCCSFRCRVSSGTYVRSLAHEMGQKMGCGAHLASLRRTQVAEFGLEDAHTLDEVGSAAADGSVEGLMFHLRRVLPGIPSVTADDETLGKIRHGRSVNLAEFSGAKLVKVFAGQSDLMCLASRVAGSLFHPKVVLLGRRARVMQCPITDIMLSTLKCAGTGWPSHANIRTTRILAISRAFPAG